MSSSPSHGLQLTSTLSADGVLELQVADVAVRAPGADEVVVRIEAAPINPSDLLTLFASADPSEARFAGTAERPRVTLQLSPEATAARAGRIGQPLAIGLEGAGVVIAAGDGAQDLVGRRVALLTLAAGLFGQYCTVHRAACVPLPEGVTSAEGAGVFVNPLTALAMPETLRQEGHAGLVHTAAASNLGRMLVKICQEDEIPLVNIVRRQEQADLLRSLGATHVCDSSAPSFHQDLVAALTATGATLAFDAIGGGTLAGQILAAMEAVAAAKLPAYSAYGSSERKQVYVYGRLDPSPVLLPQENYGLIWGVAGWAMPPILERAGPARAAELQVRVLSGLRTTFASRYGRTISLAEALQPEVMLAYARQATGEKYLIDPSR